MERSSLVSRNKKVMVVHWLISIAPGPNQPGLFTIFAMAVLHCVPKLDVNLYWANSCMVSCRSPKAIRGYLEHSNKFTAIVENIEVHRKPISLLYMVIAQNILWSMEQLFVSKSLPQKVSCQIFLGQNFQK